MEASNTNTLIKTSKTIRYIAVAEGISYILLLIISILKRTTTINIKLAMTYVGYAHGVLFILFIAAIGLGIYHLSWSFKKATIAFIASLLPFGTFVLDKQLKKDESLLA